MGHPDIEAVNLSQNFRREDKKQNNDLQRAGQHDFELPGNDAGHHHQKQRQGAQEHALILPAQHRAHQR